MFRRDISENHEKSSTAQLLSFIFLVALIAVVVRLGAPGLQPEQPLDAASVAAMPYTLAWRWILPPIPITGWKCAAAVQMPLILTH